MSCAKAVLLSKLPLTSAGRSLAFPRLPDRYGQAVIAAYKSPPYGLVNLCSKYLGFISLRDRSLHLHYIHPLQTPHMLHFKGNTKPCHVTVCTCEHCCAFYTR